MRLRPRAPLEPILWLALLACFAVGAQQSAAAAGVAVSESLPAGKIDPVVGAGGDWSSRVQQQLLEREYRASDNGVGLQAPNRAHNLRTYFGPTGIRVHDRTAAGSPELVRLSLAGVGRGEALTGVTSGEEITARESRVEIRRPGLVEWYVNSADGLEQGFTLAERPAGQGSLVVELASAGARAVLHGDAIVFETGARRKLRYGELQATDAAGRTLPARFEVPGPGRLRIVVDDAGAAYPLVIDPLLTETPDAELRPPVSQSNAHFGFGVAGAGDVNGDGYADVIVGAYQYDAGDTNEGAAFVFHGSPLGVVTAPASQLESNQPEAQFGLAVGAGDVNGDGYADVIVGAPQYYNFPVNEGAVFVFHSNGTAGITASGHPGNANAQREGNQSNAYFGYSVAGAGDVNGDGYADVIVGAFAYDHLPTYTDDGAAFVFHGGSSGIAATPASDLTASPPQNGGAFGIDVAGAGDVNGDGLGDVIVGAYLQDHNLDVDAGRAFVFHGNALGGVVGPYAVIDSNQADAQLGFSVAGAGDVNGDGYSDVIVGAYAYGAGATTSGAMGVFLGSSAGVVSNTLLSAWMRFVLPGGGGLENAQVGYSVAGVGDVNGDGYADVATAAIGWESGVGESDEGAAFVFYGRPACSPCVLSADDALLLQSNQAGGWMSTVAGAGDVDGDGYADVIVGARAYDGEGAAFVYRGGAEAVLGNPLTAASGIEADQGGAQLGFSVAGAGDVNGDGYADVIVGAPFYDSGQTNEGAAFAFHGSALGIAGGEATLYADTQLESDLMNAQLGWSVAGAGDVNGDGYGDVIVGSYVIFGFGGAAWVFLGSPGGIPDGTRLTAPTQLTSDQVGAELGISVAGAGDVNGDGLSDVIVGARAYTAGQGGEGAAFVWHGSPAGIASGTTASAPTQLESNQAGADLGISVAGAGDVNGDGLSDVIVGAWRYEEPAAQTNEGAAFIFHGNASGIPDSNPSTAGVVMYQSDQTLAQLGRTVAGAGDVNGDGFDEVIVGAYFYNADQVEEGAAFVFGGDFSTNPAGALAQLESDNPGAHLGWRGVAGAGDVNGDGFDDVIVGAPGYDNGQANEGAAFVFLGSEIGIAGCFLSRCNPTMAAAQLESNQANALLGSVAGAGDVNGDGYADVIVGAELYDAGAGAGEGAAAVFLGNGDGDGRTVWTHQRRAAPLAPPIQPWGRAGDDAFEAGLRATHPEGRGRVKLAVETCPPGVPFGDATCILDSSPSWTDVTATGAGVDLAVTVDGLTVGTLYEWRARVLYAPYTVTQGGITAPPNPSHGPWRRVATRGGGGDVRATLEDCADGVDNDNDGRTDYNAACASPMNPVGDCGCAAPADSWEADQTQSYPCDDGFDNDLDGRIDFDSYTRAESPFFLGSGDPGCENPNWPSENPQCQDGVNNDPGQDPGTPPFGHIDFDGGQFIHGYCAGGMCPPGVSDPNLDGVADPDPQCAVPGVPGTAQPWKDRERKKSCGLGFELGLLLPVLGGLRRRRRSEVSSRRE